jgi:hypothetical protein
MKDCRRCGVSKTLAEFPALNKGKDGKGLYCRACEQQRSAAYRTKHADRIEATRKASLAKTRDTRNAARRAKRAANPEATRAQRKLDYAKYKDRELTSMRKWKIANLSQMREQRNAKYWADPDAARRLQNTYRKQNVAKARLWRMNRVAATLRATPTWVDVSVTRLAYEAADMLMQLLGEWYEVDHIVPLRGAIGRVPSVCGLHVANNLQVLPRSLNRRKSNQHWPDMPVI